MLDALSDLLLTIGFTAPTVDLRPTGNTWLDAMSGKIAVDGFVVEAILGLGIDGVGTRTDQGEVSLEDDIDKLRKFVKACLAEETADVDLRRVFLKRYERKYSFDMSGMEKDILSLKEPIYAVRPVVAFGLDEKKSLNAATRWRFR